MEVELLNNQEKAVKLNKQGLKLYKQGQFQQAEKVFKEAIECYPELATSYGYLGMCYFQMINFELAEQFYIKALDIDDTNVQFLAGLAAVYIDTQQYIQAALYLEFARKVDPNNLDYLLTKGSYMFATGAYKETIDFYENLFSSGKIATIDFHEDAVIHYRLAYSYIKIDKPEEGLEIAKKFLQNPQIASKPHFNTLFTQMQAKALAKSNNLDEAVLFLQKALTETPRNIILLLELGDIYQEQKKYKLAIEKYKKALEINPNFTHLLDIIENLEKLV